jgi:hypothetical protein
MDKTVLADKDIQNGMQLVILLEKSKFEFNVAMWFLDGTGDWHFIVASPWVDTLGPKKCYELIQSVMKDMPESQKTTLKRIAVLSQNDDLICLFKTVIRTEGISQIRFSKKSINGVFIDDALIYCIC